MLGVQSLGPIWRAADVAAPEPRFLRSAECTARMQVPADPPAGAERLTSSESEAWVVLLTVPGLGPVTFAALLRAFGSAEQALEAAVGSDGPARLRLALTAACDAATSEAAERPADTEAVGEGPAPRHRAAARDLAERIRRHVDEGKRTVHLIERIGLRPLTLEDPDYPARLRMVEMPPPLLFVRGSVDALSAVHAVAVVGTRAPTDKGRLIAGWIGSALAQAGAVIVSGLAVGIDGAAHAAVVAEGKPTIAVLGGGHARVFPRAHERLADAIVEAGGAVVAELPPETAATRGTFPRRNRLISGLSDATVVVEAGHRSGALITAGWALEQGRECFLVPGPLDAPASAGCHAFLRSFPGQAHIVSGIPELIEDLGLADGVTEAGSQSGMAPAETEPVRARPRPSSSLAGAGPQSAIASLGPVERPLAELLATGPATADELAERLELPAATILSALTLLEMRGLIAGSYGRYMPIGPLARWRPGTGAIRNRNQARGPYQTARKST